MTSRELLIQGDPLLGLSQRVIPQNSQAEQALLGAMLANPKAFDMVVDFLRPEHFADPIHGRIYEAIARKVANGKVADPVTLRLEFENSRVLDEVGGTAYLAQLLSAMVGIFNAADYGRLIYDSWVRRCIIDAGGVMVDRAFGSEMTASEIVASGLNDLENTMLRSETSRCNTFDANLDLALTQITETIQRKGPAGISVGMSDVDEVMGGIEDDTLTVLGGRPGIGKTSLAMGWFLHVARHVGPVMLFSLEMSGQALARRALASAAGISVEAMRLGRLSEVDVRALAAARKYLAWLPLYIEDAGGMTPTQIALRARMAKRKRGIKLIGVDHMHIIKPEAADMKHGPTWGVGQASLALKNIAKDLRVPVLALAQLSRGLESRDDKRPSMADLRQSGDIEQNADNIAFVYRADYYMKKAPEKTGKEEKDAINLVAWEEKKAQFAGKAELIFEKLREGHCRTVDLMFDGAQTRFYQADRFHQAIPHDPRFGD